MTSTAYGKVIERRVVRDGECLISQATSMGNGYRCVRFGPHSGRKTHLVHRVVYETWKGPIPDGLLVDHNCHNRVAGRDGCRGGKSCVHRSCVNPAHLRLVTARQNVRASAIFADLSFTRPKKPPKEYCPQGHKYDQKNTYHYNGTYSCRVCNRAKAARSREKKHA